MLIDAFILVVVPIIVAGGGISAEIVDHLVLIEREVAAVRIGVLVVGVELTALTTAALVFSIF